MCSNNVAHMVGTRVLLVLSSISPVCSRQGFDADGVGCSTHSMPPIMSLEGAQRRWNPCQFLCDSDTETRWLRTVHAKHRPNGRQLPLHLPRSHQVPRYLPLHLLSRKPQTGHSAQVQYLTSKYRIMLSVDLRGALNHATWHGSF